MRADRAAPIMGRNDGCGSFQHHDGPCATRGLHRRRLTSRRGQKPREQAFKLSLMRGQDVVAIQQGEQLLRSILKQGQGVRIHDQGRPRSRQGHQVVRRGVGQSRRRTDDDGIHRLRQGLKLLRPGEGGQHHGLQAGRQNHGGVRRAEDLHQPCTAPQPGPRRQPRRAGRQRTARHHAQTAAHVLVGLRGRPRQAIAPFAGVVMRLHVDFRSRKASTDENRLPYCAMQCPFTTRASDQQRSRLGIRHEED